MMGDERSRSDDTATAQVRDLDDTELAAVAGGATIPLVKKPKGGSGSGSETHDTDLKNQSTKLR